MAHFRVAHLAFGQTDIETARAQGPSGKIAINPVVKRRAGEQRGVAVLLAFFPAAGIDAPAIANDEQDRLRHGGAVSRLSPACTSAFPRCEIDKAKRALLHRPNEMAQSVARAFLPDPVRGVWCFLFSILGGPKTIRHHPVRR